MVTFAFVRLRRMLIAANCSLYSQAAMAIPLEGTSNLLNSQQRTLANCDARLWRAGPFKFLKIEGALAQRDEAKIYKNYFVMK